MKQMTPVFATLQKIAALSHFRLAKGGWGGGPKNKPHGVAFSMMSIPPLNKGFLIMPTQWFHPSEAV